ncbi:MAG: hypothetical protein K0R51_166 [Cytophagaceae bacterium]|jgi:hypothetical protein|nr:hypothetical protein [Cytophagaceae bacterium]
MLFSKSTTYFLSVLLVAVGIAVFTGCRKIPKFSETPKIEYKDIRKVTFFNADQLIDADSIILGIHFEDGDGDLGFPEDQRGEDNLDYFVDVYRQTNGVFNQLTFPSGVTFDGHMPLLAPVSTPGPLEGDIFYNMIFNYSTDQPTDDTLKFVVHIKDRKGNYSNSVESDPIVIRKTP